MPIGLTQDPGVDLDRLDQGAASLPVSQGLRTVEMYGHAPALRTGLQFGKHLVLDTLGIDPADPVSQGNSFGDIDTRMSAEEANDRYGFEGGPRFNAPVTEADAAWQAAGARQAQFRDTVFSLTKPAPLTDFGASLAGTLLDPGNLALMAATGPLGDAAALGLGLRGAGEAAEAGVAVSKLGRLVAAGRVVGEGVAVNAPFVAASAGLHAVSGDDYGMGDVLTDLAAGAVFHVGLHALGAGWSALRGGPAASVEDGLEAAQRPVRNPAAMVPLSGVPEAVQDLAPAARAGAFVKAVDDLAGDEPVDVARFVDRELQAPDPARLNEASAQPAVASFRPLDEATAVTPRGTDVPVRYGLAELGDLVTSHDDHLSVNPAYPAELQPRDRARAGAQARNYQLEAELNPKLLMGETSAAAGAPVISPDGVVESGNGRTIALRRSAAGNGEAYGRYRAELKARGYHTEGMNQPVLVRMRTQAMEGGQRAALAREMNADVNERMSASEQAMADARRLDGPLAALEGRPALGDRDFTRGFIAQVAPDQQNLFVDKDGRLSPEGERRIKAALLARAYEDPRLVGQIFEAEDAPARQLGEALAEAAPAWAKMRALAAAGEIPRELDLTPSIRSAMDLVRYAKSEGIPLGELISERLGQTEMFGGQAIGPATEAILRMAYRDAEFKKPTARDKLAAALKDYARQASEVTPGENLFGETAGDDTARQILANTAERFARGDAGNLDVRPPGRAEGPAAAPPRIDLRPPGGERDGGSGELSPDGGEGDGGAAAGGEAKPRKLTGALIIAADPELKALAEDIDGLLAQHGIELPPADKDNPDTLAEAIRAAAVCIAEEGL